MNITAQIASHFRAVHFGGNWTSVNIKKVLEDVTREEAITQVYDLNTIAILVFHINYYVSGVLKVLKGGTLDIKDKYSFECPPIKNQQDWQQLVEKTLTEAEEFAQHIEQLPDAALWEDFTDPKYGNYYKNLHGIIEHTHYHLGQIVLIKKILRSESGNFI